MKDDAEGKAEDEMEEEEDDDAEREESDAVAIQYLHTVGRCRAILPPDEQKDSNAKLTGLMTPAQLTHNCIAKARRRYAELRAILEKASNV